MHKWSSRKRWGVYLPFAHCICLYADLHCNEPADMNAFLHPTTCWVQGERDVLRCWTNCPAHGWTSSGLTCIMWAQERKFSRGYQTLKMKSVSDNLASCRHFQSSCPEESPDSYSQLDLLHALRSILVAFRWPWSACVAMLSLRPCPTPPRFSLPP